MRRRTEIKIIASRVSRLVFLDFLYYGKSNPGANSAQKILWRDTVIVHLKEYGNSLNPFVRLFYLQMYFFLKFIIIDLTIKKLTIIPYTVLVFIV